MKQEQPSKKKYILVLFLLPILLLGVTYAWLSFTSYATKTNTMEVGTLSLTLDDSLKEGISLLSAVPTADEVGKSYRAYSFTLTNNGTINSDYTIYLDDEPLEASEARINDQSLKYNLTSDDGVNRLDLLSTTGSNPNRILLKSRIAPKETIRYELRLWIDQDATNEVMNQVFRGKIRVEATQAIEKAPTDSKYFTFDQDANTITGYSSTGPKDVVIPKSIDGVAVKTIGSLAFANQNLTSLEIQEGITTINYGAFINNKLRSLNLPTTLTAINQEVFNNNLLPDSEAFIYKRNLDGSIDKTALIGYGGENREHVIIPSNVTRILSGTMNGLALKKITIPQSVTEISPVSFNNNQLSDEQAFIYKRNPDGSEDKSTIVSYGGAKRENVIIPSTVENITEFAFTNCKITSITLSPNTKTIGSQAFNTNQLTEITIPSTVTKIESSAFYKNSSSANPNLTKIINKTGKSFDWQAITGGSAPATFITGVIPHTLGNITVTDQ